MFKGGSQCIPLWMCFTLVHSTPSITLPYPLTSHPDFIAFNTYPYILYLHICYVLWYCWFLSFSFLFPPSPCLYTMMLVFVYVYLFIYLPHVIENMTLSFWVCLTSLNMMSSNCIHLPSNYMGTLFLIDE
jgi:hypothetical protein